MHYFLIRSSLFQTFVALHMVKLPIFDKRKLCNLINKSDVGILLVKLATETNRRFSLENDFQITRMCLNKTFLRPIEYLRDTFEH